MFGALWLRVYRLDAQSYWNDEGNSRVMTAKSVGEIVQATQADIHPPAYYLALKGWRMGLGETEFALRSLSAFAGVVLVALLYRLGRTYHDEWAGLGAALFGAVNPFLIYYAQEARMYALLAMLGAASFLLFSLWLKATRTRVGFSQLAVGYWAMTTLGLYTHYAFPFILLAQNLAALGGLLAHRTPNWKQRLGAWGALQLLVAVSFLPWLPTAYQQLTAWPAAREFHPLLEAGLEVARYLTFGRTVSTTEVFWGLAGAGGLVWLGLRRGGQTITPLLWLGVPVGLTLAFGLLSEAFSKFLLIAVPAGCVVLGNSWGVRGQTQDTSYKVIFIALWLVCLAPFAASTYASLHHLYFDSAYARDDYRGIARYIENLQRPGDAVITLAPNQVEAFAYYHRAGAEIFPLPSQRPLDEAATLAELKTLTTRHARLFVLYWGERQADPNGVIEQWLNTQTFKAGEQWHGQIRLATYAVSAPATHIEHPSGARFGDHLTLLGYTLQSETLAPGDILQLTLFWQTDQLLGERYKVFVHLYADPFAPPEAQQDGEPSGGLTPTDSWQPEQIYADNHGILLPADLPPGDYRLAIGLYHLFDATRLPITLSGTTGRDRLELQTITVER